MPVSNVARRMRGLWPTVEQRAGQFRPSIPAAGMARSDYEAAVLFDVDPAFRVEVFGLLHRRGLAWVRRRSGEIVVFPVRPRSIALPPTGASAPAGRLCSAMAAHMLALHEAEAARRLAQDRGSGDALWRAQDEVALHCARATAVIVKHAGDGLPVETVRRAITAFSALAVGALVSTMPELAPASGASRIDLPQTPAKPKRLDHGLDLRSKVLGLIHKGGLAGVVRKKLAEGVRPRPGKETIDAILAGLEADGAILSGVMRLHPVGRPGVRFFAAEFGLPIVNPDGTAIVPPI